ncbi:MAG: carbohydrate binding domain-containing protein [Bacteroidales bacterium]|nr:carbohydrate binding domain-containing protein [Bacteroidales bacterium]
MRKLSIIALGLLCLCGLNANAATYDMTVNAKKAGVAINPDMYGIFFEDINFGADGGLYAELVKNRSFEFPQSLMGWNIFGNVELRTDGAPFERNPHYVRLTYSGHSDKHTGLDNEGFFGMGFEKGATYRFSVWARAEAGNQRIRIELINSGNDIMTKQTLAISGNEWKKYEVTLTAPAEEAKGKLRIFLETRGPVDLEHISLFPTDTWQGRENGLRKDLAQALYDLRPGVFRFPGGCIVEGTDIDTRYDWKKSIGPVENRPLNENRWHYTFAYRLFPDYFQSYGMGFYEFFLLAEDIGAAPLPVLNVGLACQYQNNSMDAHIPVDELQPYIQDALDLIQFANGAADTEWGKVRADMGHPEPFHLKYLAIGNEQWGPEYPERLEQFVKAIRAKYPDIQIVGSAGPSASGEKFDYLWPEMKRLKVDLVDEHYYQPPTWFYSNAARYDSYDRKGPKVFAGEYASHAQPGKPNSWEAALSEASFMTGLERNADVVRLATYAPLFAHIDGWQWNPDLIWFDNLRMMRTPNYYVQQLYGTNSGTNVLSILMNGQKVTGQEGLYATACTDSRTNEIIVKFTNTATEAKTIRFTFDGLKKGSRTATVKYITAPAYKAENTLDNPDVVVPRETTTQFTDNVLEFEAAPQAFYVIRFAK